MIEMGASKEKKKRLEEKNSGIQSKWDEREEERIKAKQQSRKYYIIGAAILVVCAAILFFSSNFFYRTFDAVKIGDEGYSAPEYKFFYTDTYYSYYNTYYQSYGEYAQYFMPDEETLKNATFENMVQVTALYNAAKEAGHELSEENKKTIDENIESLKEYAVENGYTGTKSYLSAQFGKGMTEKLYRELMEKSTLASSYYQAMRESYSFTDDELRTYYSEHSNDLDRFTYYYKFFSGSAVEDDEETEEDETKTKEEAMAEAKESAEAYAEGDVYGKIKEEATAQTQYGANISSDYASWLQQTDRKEGDSTLIETEGGYYVVCFVSRDDNDYRMINVRHILIQPETVNKSDYDTDEAYNEAVSKADEDAKAKAEALYEEWKNGEATEESFAALADENSTDGAEGGLYENVYKGQMVEEFEDWCFESHEAGDTGIVKTSYGYHIMYFVGLGDEYQLHTADEEWRNDNYEKWLEDQKGNYEVKTTAMFNFAD